MAISYMQPLLPQYGSPIGGQSPQSALVAALLANGNTRPDITQPPSLFQSNPGYAMASLQKWKQLLGSPSNTIPGTGLFGTRFRGITYAQGAAPGPNQIEPM